MKTVYWLTALMIVYGVLPRMSGIPDQLYGSGKPMLQSVAVVLRTVDVEDWVSSFKLPDFGTRSQVKRWRLAPPPPMPVKRPANVSQAAILDTAETYLGTRYVWGGNDDSGIDCSGFVRNVFGKNGIKIPRVVRQQFYVGIPVAKNALQPGDLVFFETTRRGPSHVGIYVGGDVFIHASSGRKKVTTAIFSKKYYQRRFLGGRRIL